MLTVVGFPRSGTNFLTRMLAHYIDGPDVEVWPGTPEHAHVRKIHWRYQDVNYTSMPYIYRDPRDCALSGWEYVRNGFKPTLGLWEFLEGPFSGYWDLWPCGWKEHTRYWLDRGITATVSYEDLCADREAILRKLVLQLHGAVYESRIPHAVRQSYNFGERHDGRWANELPAEAAAWIDDYCGDLMGELGYAQKGET